MAKALDGQATDENWWQWKGGKTAKQAGPTNYLPQSPGKAVDENVAVEKRQFGEGSYLRPALSNLIAAKMF